MQLTTEQMAHGWGTITRLMIKDPDRTPDDVAAAVRLAVHYAGLASVPISKGHVGFIGQFEYFKNLKGNLFGAPTDCVLDCRTGYRCGARWECPAHMADQRIEELKKIYS